MTPKEKAEELVEKYLFMYRPSLHPPYLKANEAAKQCALIAVDEIINVINRDMNYQNTYAYFLDVKTEIEKL